MPLYVFPRHLSIHYYVLWYVQFLPNYIGQPLCFVLEALYSHLCSFLHAWKPTDSFFPFPGSLHPSNFFFHLKPSKDSITVAFWHSWLLSASPKIMIFYFLSLWISCSMVSTALFFCFPFLPIYIHQVSFFFFLSPRSRIFFFVLHTPRIDESKPSFI